MKQSLSAAAMIGLFILMLTFPKQTLSGASEGLLLWFQILLPTLLPFFILTNLLLQTNSIVYISYIIGPLFEKLFQVSHNGSFAVLSGFLCGYPVGAKVTADMVRTNKITLEEGKYLLSFCNNTSPAFIMSFLVIQNLKDESLLFLTLFILYLSPILCSFLFRKIYCKKNTPIHPVSSQPEFKLNFRIIDECIMNAFENITKIGGYIILFSILIALGENSPFSPLLPLLEITNGIPRFIEIVPDFDLCYLLLMFLTSFGGVCAVAQTNSMLHDTELSIFPYIIEKLITAMVTSLLVIVSIYCCKY